MTYTATTGTCIIVGGGIGGVMVAKNLKKSGLEVTIIDRQNYLDWSIAAARSLVSPDDIDKHNYAMPLDKVSEFMGAKFVQSAVAQVSEKSVTLANGDVLNADFVVVAIGGQYGSGALWKPTPELTTKEKRVAAFRAEREKAAAAKAIVVAGAGLAGVEVAGELKAAFPDAKVTLVGTFLPFASDNTKAKVRTALEEMGVILTDGRVEDPKPVNGKVKTSSNETLDADIVYMATGFIFAGAKLLDDNLKSNVTENGQVSCRPTLQLDGCDTVFACGDIVKVPDGKYADVKGSMHAEAMAKTVAANVMNLMAGKELSSFKWSEKANNVPSFTALGPDVGVGDLGMPSFMGGIENWMARKVKTADFFMTFRAADFGKGKTW
jgi:NADH dehydrogenase FAD-containing subunit